MSDGLRRYGFPFTNNIILWSSTGSKICIEYTDKWIVSDSHFVRFINHTTPVAVFFGYGHIHIGLTGTNPNFANQYVFYCNCIAGRYY